MDEKGFIFSLDAVLALVVMIVITASIVTYGRLPIYQGENHQHLETLADSVLATMDQNGALRAATVEYDSGDPTQQALAISTLNASLSTLIPSNIGYTLYVGDNLTITNNNGILTSSDVATKVRVISGPSEGWMGRAYYKQDSVNFTTVNETDVTTLWNSHDYLQNFNPWNNGLINDKYWGSNAQGTSPMPINFTVPEQ